MATSVALTCQVIPKKTSSNADYQIRGVLREVLEH